MAQRTCEITGCSAPHRARGLCSTHYNRAILGERRRHPVISKGCVVCGTTVTRRRDAGFAATCSVRCRQVVQFGAGFAPRTSGEWAKWAEQRARDAGVHVEHFDRETVFARDGWTCQRCHVTCAAPDPYRLDSATIDHIVPLTAGGPHTQHNAQTLCLSCNSAKGVTDKGLTAV